MSGAAVRLLWRRSLQDSQLWLFARASALVKTFIIVAQRRTEPLLPLPLSAQGSELEVGANDALK